MPQTPQSDATGPRPALPAPRTPSPRDAPALKWGVIAPGGIAASFVDALHTYTGQRAVAVGSRDPARARAFAERFDIPAAHGSYAELLADRDVDIVYVASPHSGHFEQALAAIEAGRHVLVEKAFTRNAREAELLVEAARKRDVFLMEAMWTRFLPHMDVVRQVLASGMLGEVHTVTADHGQYMEHDASHRLFAPGLAGGALLDLGVYPLSFASMVLGPFASITAVGTKTATGVDGQASIVVTNASGAHGVLNTTLFARTPTTASISGSLARLEIEGDFYAPAAVRLISREGEVLDTHVPERRAGGLCYEAAEAARCVAAGRLESDLMPLAETLGVMRALDGVRRDLGVVYPGE
ncbi:1,5-anhydro-D-fructose reductase [Streptomyces sp. ADI96-02]|uniref:Gfo/Idh/MocA family protein n=1 Tax=Streptomyces sp. ADI96-02 TaxID=1522760 RepID=UPI000F5501A8|nr:Gfo/Idh/MocA family oxidoreductase [Streptomyces sp. ADI96-02]RPK67485.1 1,5-anhydro-D-fructose reductase [Streptomyces sp. ADI96-02]